MCYGLSVTCYGEEGGRIVGRERWAGSRYSVVGSCEKRLAEDCGR